MTDLFLLVLNNGISFGWLALFVMLIRLLFRRAPKALFPALWGIAALRLLLPVRISAPFSLVPAVSFDALKAAPGVMRFVPYIWAAGATAILIYGLASYLRLRIRLRTAVRRESGVYLSEFVPFPFVLGLIHPRIYLPFGLDPADEANVLLHERTHIRRLDHVMKPISFALLAVNWFNPLIWAAYLMLCRDMELACDEAVSSALGDIERASYSQTLLSLSLSGRSVSVCPLAFGGGSLKKRVELVTSGARPKTWAKCVSAALAIVFVLCFLTDPVPKAEREISAKKEIERTIDLPYKQVPIREKSDKASKASPLPSGPYEDEAKDELDLTDVSLSSDNAPEFSFALLVYAPDGSGSYCFSPELTDKCSERLDIPDGTPYVLSVRINRAEDADELYNAAENSGGQVVTLSPPDGNEYFYLLLPIEKGGTV